MSLETQQPTPPLSPTEGSWDKDTRYQTVSRRKAPQVAPHQEEVSSSHLRVLDPLHPHEHIRHGASLEVSKQMPTASGSSDLPLQQRPPFSTTKTATSIAVLSQNESAIDEPEVMLLSNPPRNKWRLGSNFIWFLMLGMNDGVLGALLPHIESHYNISYAIVSLIWLGNAIGFIVIAFTAHLIDDKLGLQKMVTLSAAFMTLEFAIVASGTVFPAIVVGFFFGGLGAAIGLSQLNIFVAKLKDGPKYLGACHGMYGVGACLSPIFATSMVNGGVKWNYFYFIMLALSLTASVALALAYKGVDEDLEKWDSPERVVNASSNSRQDDPEALADIEMEQVGELPVQSPVENEKKHDFKAALQDYRSWAICIFIFFYQGAEVSMGGWMVTFLLNYRGGDEYATGYVASGYWAGISLGRFLLTHRLMNWFGCRRSLIVLSFFMIGLDVLAWLVPNNIGSAVCAALVGVSIGPVYTMAVSLATRILPRKIRFCALTLVTAFGSSGGSAVPFTVGMASRFVGTYVLHPVFITCIGGMLLSWLVLPNVERKGAISTFWQKIW